MTKPPHRRPSRRAWALYAGVAAFAIVAALTTRAVWQAWRVRAGQARADAVFQLVQQRTPPRPSEAPGAMAWLEQQLLDYTRRIPDPEAARIYANLARGDAVPSELTEAVAAMQTLTSRPFDPAPGVSWQAIGDEDDSARQQWVVAAGDSHVAVTRRRSIAPGGDSDRFVAALAPILAEGRVAVAAALARRLPYDRLYDGRADPVRLYAVAEDGTLVSSPWSQVGGPRAAAAVEAALLSAHPTLPTFAPEEFFFRRHGAATPTYSGFYLDLGGRGLVSTLIVPLAGSVMRGVLALDLACEIDWRRFAETIEPPVAGTTVTPARLDDPVWPAFRAALPASAQPIVHRALGRLAARDPGGVTVRATGPLTHAVVDDVGAAAAFHVSESRWLLMVFPNAPAPFPSGAVLLLGVTLALLLGGFEVNRRRAEREEAKARHALDEKQNLLNTMQVPLMVVDPNTDTIVSSNRAADVLGIRRGLRFADLVSPEPRARAHYEHMQVASPEPRRAYGVPIRVPGSQDCRLAVVRSVAVTAPIEALEADERHRLGILFLLEPDTDLRLYTEDLSAAAHRDERRRLAGLLSHGMDALLRVLHHALADRDSWEPDAREFATWLAEYLERRLQVTAWLLDRWDAPPPPSECVVDAAQARDTIDRIARVFRIVGRSAALRSQLRWDNGTLAQIGDEPVLDVSFDWPEDYQLPLPVRGGFGLFVAETLTNAVRHGASGSRPSIRISCDPVRRELQVTVENTIDARGAATADARAESYGGLSILRAMARLFGWRDLTIGPSGSRFIVAWRAPLTRRDPSGRAD